jgi:hypothetical protein
MSLMSARAVGRTDSLDTAPLATRPALSYPSAPTGHTVRCKTSHAALDSKSARSAVCGNQSTSLGTPHCSLGYKVLVANHRVRAVISDEAGGFAGTVARSVMAEERYGPSFLRL